MIANNLRNYLKNLPSTHDDDPIDRLNYVWSIYVLLGLSVTIFAKNYVGEPMQCWVPKQWTGDWENFAESYCFLENTYFVPMNDTNLPQVKTREGREMIYYQWVPFILALMALFFYFPRAIWKTFSKYSGLALSDMMSSAHKASKAYNKTCDLSPLVQNMQNRLYSRPSRNTLSYGSSLFNLYILMKVFMWINLFVQFYFLNHFLGTGYILWGWGILMDLINGRHWQESGHFPRVAFCDLTVREMGNVNNWTVQCVLMVNMFNEKIFLFLWWWMVFLLILTTFNVIGWFGQRLMAGLRRGFLQRLHDAEDLQDNQLLDKFYKEVLKDDGVLILRLLDSNAGSIQAGILFKRLWELFTAQSAQSSALNSPALMKGADDIPLKDMHGESSRYSEPPHKE